MSLQSAQQQKVQASPNWGGTIRQYLYYWPLFLICLVLTLTAAFFYQKTLKPVYEVKATLLIKNEKKATDQQGSAHDIDLLNTPRIIENEIEILSSKQLVGKVVRDLKLWVKYQRKDGFLSYQDLYKESPVELSPVAGDKDISHGVITIIVKDKDSFSLAAADGKFQSLSFNKIYKSNFGSWKLIPTKTLTDYIGATIKITVDDPNQVALGYQKAISASLPNKLATVVELSLTDQVAQRGKNVLDTLIFDYNIADAIDKDQDAKKAIDSIDKSIQSLGGQVNREEKGIEAFKSSRGLTDIAAASTNSQQQKADNARELNSISVKLNVINGIEQYVNSSQSSAPPSTNEINDQTLIKSIDKLYDLQSRRDKLLATVPETNPDVKDLNKLIENTKSEIKSNVRNLKETLESQKNGLQSVNNRIESDIKKIPTQERQYGNLTRNQVGKETILSYLLQRREEIRLSAVSKVKNDRIVDPAYIGQVQSKNAMIYAIALLVGLGLPGGYVFGKKKLSNSITSLDDINNLLGIPVIIELPFEDSPGVVITDTHATVTSEQFRILRTKLYYLNNMQERGRVILLTSSIAGEGKSFINENLGRTLAFANRKTIVLELDLRKPKLAEAFNLPKEHRGITDYLKGDAVLNEIIQHSVILENLHIISSGTTATNPSELLETKALATLINELTNIYDDVIIDSPPINLVADALIIARLADITLFVIRQGFTKKADLSIINELHQQKQLNNVHIIFNGIQRSKYGYGYSYNNDYYNNKKPGLINRFSKKS